jgi:large subunit ribosomal protein L47
MRAIKHTLTERQYAWEDARKLASADPSIIVEGDRLMYDEELDEYDEEEVEEEEEEEEADVFERESREEETPEEKAVPENEKKS